MSMTCFTVSGIMLFMSICDSSTTKERIVTTCGSKYQIRKYLEYNLNDWEFKGTAVRYDKQKAIKPVFYSKKEYCGMFRGKKKWTD